MKAIILAAGEGMRMRPLTLDTPKPLLQVGGITLLDHIFKALPAEITEAVIVTKYLGEQIREYCGAMFHGRHIQYADGSDQGTAYSFLAAKPFVTDDRFLFLYGDEFPDSDDIKRALTFPASIVCWEVSDPWNHGVATLREDGTIAEIIEKPEHPTSNFIADGIMVLSRKIFSYQPEKKPNGEYYFTSMVNQFVRDERVMAVKSEQKIGGISTLADVERVEKLLAKVKG